LEVLEREFAKPAMELIKVSGPRGENQRYGGALVLRELAENAPAVVYDRRGPFFDTIWLVVNDLTSTVRVRAAAALGAMLRLVHERKSTPKYSRLVLDKIEEGFDQGTAERVHGSLLTLRQLLRHPGPWMGHRHRRRRRRHRRGSAEETHVGGGGGGGSGGGGASGTATPFATGTATPFASGGSSASARPPGMQMLPPPARLVGGGGGGGAVGDLSRAF
ncbi:unnamed protein product, partial [Hapterophycus canaliculatus]